MMVDEFQDTNRLQCELIDLLRARGAELFFVGDEFQSIYRFRHADVEVFRERRAQVGGVLALTQNYRSRPEVLDVVNELFAAEFGDDFQPLEAAGRFPDPAFGPAGRAARDRQAELQGHGHALASRRGAARRAPRAGARATRARRRRATSSSCSRRARTPKSYEEELRALGLPTYRAAGRGYFGQQQVVDLLAYLRLLHNRYDDEALVTVLASPLVGVSNDALVLLRRAAPSDRSSRGLERALPAGLSASATSSFPRLPPALRPAGRAVADGRRSSGCASRSSPSTTTTSPCWRSGTDAAATRTCASSRGSRARTRSCAAPTSRASSASSPTRTRPVRTSSRRSPRRRAPDAVRLLTIHAAKGLEFKVVVVADAGRDRPPARGEEILCLPDGRFGFRVADPSTGKRRAAFDYEARAGRPRRTRTRPSGAASTTWR